MKAFDIPELSEVNGLYIEPVCAASGFKGTTPDSDPGPGGDWDIRAEWCNHNTGSHSEIKIKAHNYGNGSGDNLTMSFYIRNFELDSITPGDGCLIVSNLSAHSFTLSRVNRHFNPGENIEFVMQLKCKKPGGGVGAVGVTGQYVACEVYCTSVFTS